MTESIEIQEASHFDQFFLKHLQSVKADSAYYLNQRFLGKGGCHSAWNIDPLSGVIGVQN